MNTCRLPFPRQINLAQLPTPLQPLRRLGEKLGVDLYVKRDDLTGSALSGNKIRKLEFVLADALDQHGPGFQAIGFGRPVAGAFAQHVRDAELDVRAFVPGHLGALWFLAGLERFDKLFRIVLDQHFLESFPGTERRAHFRARHQDGLDRPAPGVHAPKAGHGRIGGH